MIRKIKIEINNEELRLIRYSLVDFRNSLLNENRDCSPIDEVIVKLKNKMKVDKYDLGIIINGLNNMRGMLVKEGKNTYEVDTLILRLIDIDESL